MFAFDSIAEVKSVVARLPAVGVGQKYGLPVSRKASLLTPRELFRHSDMPVRWQRREISNFDYLMFLNTVAGRTYNDHTQYPVFPWILTNYTTDTLDVNDPSNYRDLGKTEQQRRQLEERYVSWPTSERREPAFHHDAHYSTQRGVLRWMNKLEPFATIADQLRLTATVSDVASEWRDSTSGETCAELIPELFYLTDILLAGGGVHLPKWAGNSADQFVAIHRAALESDVVSCQLNQWIDLVFGYKQRGAEAVRSLNVFCHLAYEGGLDGNALKALDADERERVARQIAEFGQTPAQLLTEPHAPRHSASSSSSAAAQLRQQKQQQQQQPSANQQQQQQSELCMLMKFISNSPIVHLSANTHLQLAQPVVLSVAQNLVFALNRWNASYMHEDIVSRGTHQSPQQSEQDESSTSSPTSTAQLPLVVDPLLASGNPTQPVPKRHLGDALDANVTIGPSSFVSSSDSRSLLVVGYSDCSLRIFDTESARLRQVVYGHSDVALCIARSEAALHADCYVATGSRDCTVLLWHWSHTQQAIAGEWGESGETPTPRALITGHKTPVCALLVSAEHGLVFSGAQDGTILKHNTSGDLLCRIRSSSAPHQSIGWLGMSRDGVLVAQLGERRLQTWWMSTGREMDVLPTTFDTSPILCCSLSRDATLLATGHADGRLSLYRLFPLRHLHIYHAVESAIRSVVFTWSARFVLAGLESGAIVVLHTDRAQHH